jgi:hypothetical protein
MPWGITHEPFIPAAGERAEHIASLAASFRRAIERCNRLHLPYSFKKFPLGSCGDSTPLSGTFLKQHGLGSFMHIQGIRHGHTHAWLEADGLIVDISADQFPEIADQVIVASQSQWHATFQRVESRPHEADYRIYDENAVAGLRAAYCAILAEISA